MATFPGLFDAEVQLGGPLAATRAEPSEESRELAALFSQHAPRVQRFLRDVLRDDALAWDATQETFARAFGHLAQLRDPDGAVAWLFGVARNVSRELRRSRFRAGRVITQESGELERAPARTGACPEAHYLDHEALRVVDAALVRLSEDRRAVLLLRLDHGLSYDAIATLMGWSLAKVKIEIFRAREVLRATMDEYRRGER